MDHNQLLCSTAQARASESGDIGAQDRRGKVHYASREPFHRGEAAADRMNNLYPPIYRMSVAARGMGLGEDYSMSVPVGTRKKDIEWIVDDGLQVRNRNFVQSTKLVR